MSVKAVHYGVFSETLTLAESLTTRVIRVGGGGSGGLWCGLSTGTGDDYQLTAAGLTAYVDGLQVLWKADRSCGPGPVRIQLNSLGFAAVRKGGSYELSLPDIVAGEVIFCVWDGSQWNAIAGVGDNPVDGGVF